jgi:hypothetical protein
MRGDEVKRVCSFGRGVKGGCWEGASMTQLRRCERMRLVDAMLEFAFCGVQGLGGTYLTDMLGLLYGTLEVRAEVLSSLYRSGTPGLSLGRLVGGF